MKKSKNLLKLESKLRAIRRRIRNKLVTNIHNFTAHIVKLNPKAVVIENLVVNHLRKLKNIGEKINEAHFYEIRWQLEYKCSWKGIPVIIADRFYPSSKKCSCCGNVKEKLSLSERVYVCEKCGYVEDRDFNASLNLRNLALQPNC